LKLRQRNGKRDSRGKQTYRALRSILGHLHLLAISRPSEDCLIPICQPSSRRTDQRNGNRKEAGGQDKYGWSELRRDNAISRHSRNGAREEVNDPPRFKKAFQRRRNDKKGDNSPADLFTTRFSTDTHQRLLRILLELPLLGPLRDFLRLERYRELQIPAKRRPTHLESVPIIFRWEAVSRRWTYFLIGPTSLISARYDDRMFAYRLNRVDIFGSFRRSK